MESVRDGKQHEFSSLFINTVDKVLEYPQTSPQQLDTTKGTLFGHIIPLPNYFQNMKNYQGQLKQNSIMSGNTLDKAQATDLCNDLGLV